MTPPTVDTQVQERGQIISRKKGLLQGRKNFQDLCDRQKRMSVSTTSGTNGTGAACAVSVRDGAGCADVAVEMAMTGKSVVTNVGSAFVGCSAI